VQAKTYALARATVATLERLGDVEWRTVTAAEKPVGYANSAAKRCEMICLASSTNSPTI
jgi:hypothetical protein